MRDGTEVHIRTIEDFVIGSEEVHVFTKDGPSFQLPISNFRDKSCLVNIEKGDQIISMSNGIGIKKVFFPVYEMKFGVYE